MSLRTAAVAALLWAVPAAALERTQYTVIVANNKSPSRALKDLRFADDDGARYYELFAPQSTRSFLLAVLDAETQRRHKGLASVAKEPSRRVLLETLSWVKGQMDQDRRVGKEPVLFFVFAGHGARLDTGEGTIALGDGPFTRSDFYRHILEPFRASMVHLIVDACDSYFVVHPRGATSHEPSYGPLVAQFLEQRVLAGFPNVGVILSTAGQQESHEWSAISSGVFSHQIRSALSGAADVNMDGRVEYSELRAFIAAANAQVQDARARLQMYAEPPARNRAVALVDYTRSAALSYLIVPAPLEGRYWIEDDRGVRAAEFNKSGDRPLLVTLAPGRAYYLRSPRSEARFELAGERSVLDGAHLIWQPVPVAGRGSIEEDLREHLFSVPYGPAFYTGFVSSTGEVAVAPRVRPDGLP